MTRNSTSGATKLNGLFRKLKGFRRIFTRFEKLDIMFRGFLHLALAYLIL